MKVGILTFHSAGNYGAMLQAYALPTVVKKLGHECELIDYRADETIHETYVEWPSDLLKMYGPFLGLIKIVNRWRLGWYSKNNKRTNYSLFLRKYLPISKKRYHSIGELNNISYDAILFGSDQIWNEEITKDATSIYLGDFCNKIGIRRIAYAASNGRDYFPDELNNVFKKGLSRFYALGIREKGLANYINYKFRFDTTTVLDPVFLLESDEWRQLKVKLPKGVEAGKHIFVYTFDEQPVYDYARKLARERNLQIVVLRWCGKSNKLSDMIQFWSSSPREFISFIDNAAVVCTSSFHGTAFSLIFGKELYAIAPQSLGSRIDSLMLLFGNKNMSKYGDRNLYHCSGSIYRTIHENMHSIKGKSIDFLKDSLR